MKQLAVLYVEDEPLVQRATSRMLQHLYPGILLITADSVKEAKEALLCRSFNLVLCDIVLPDGTGVELHQWASQKVPRYLDRFIFCSGYAMDPLVDYINKSPCEFLQKPFTMTALRRSWDETIKRHPFDSESCGAIKIGNPSN